MSTLLTRLATELVKAIMHAPPKDLSMLCLAQFQAG